MKQIIIVLLTFSVFCTCSNQTESKTKIEDVKHTKYISDTIIGEKSITNEIAGSAYRKRATGYFVIVNNDTSDFMPIFTESKDDNIIGIKDSSADMLYYQTLINQVSSGFNVIQGYGSLFLPSLVLGGRITFCGEANLAPRILVEMYESYSKGDLKKAREMHFRLVNLVSIFNYGTFPASIKEAMNILGLPGGYAIHPTASLDETEMNEIKNALKKAGLNANVSE